MAIIYEPGRRIGKDRAIEILEVLRCAEHVVIYRARDVNNGNQLIVKSHPEPVPRDDEIFQRFRYEGKRLRKVIHPHIARSVDYGTSAGVVFNAQLLIPGEDLARHIRRHGPLPVGEAVRLGVQIADALSLAHELGIIHRDVKPENVMIRESDRSAVVVDFGIARFIEKSVELTMPDVALGTSGYWAPEVCVGGEAVFASDVFSFGAVFFEMLTGSEPFARETARERDKALVGADHPDLRVEVPGIPEDLARLVDEMLRKVPRRRPKSFAHVLERLAPFHLGNSAGA